LRNIRHDDMVTLTTLLGEFRYRVVSTAIVRPDNIAVRTAFFSASYGRRTEEV
jgi:sortase (surface protein transpeptidase)